MGVELGNGTIKVVVNSDIFKHLQNIPCDPKCSPLLSIELGVKKSLDHLFGLQSIELTPNMVDFISEPPIY